MLVSQSTYRLLQAIYDVRLRIFEVVLGSLLVAAVLTFVVAATIARPIRRLRRDAAELLDHRGRLTRRFQASARLDEIGDLGRALDELTRRLDEHLRFVEAFSADVSHEFKNPLASIRTIAEMLASVEDPAERERFLAMMRRDVERLERLLSGVREIATIDAQLERETTTGVDVRAILTNVADAHRLRAQGRVTIDIAPPAPPLPTAPAYVRAAPERLAQVFDNLVDNAIGFSPDGGTVTIAIEKIDGDCRISIRDEGPGIPPTHLTRVFERFFTYRPGTPDNRRHHTGLGLAIAKAIVESYGGTIAATSARRSQRRVPHRAAAADPALATDARIGLVALRACQEISESLWASRRPAGKARRPRIVALCKGGATPPVGMPRRPERLTYFLTGPNAESVLRLVAERARKSGCHRLWSGWRFQSQDQPVDELRVLVPPCAACSSTS